MATRTKQEATTTGEQEARALARVRWIAEELCYVVLKSRRPLGDENAGGYMVVDLWDREVFLGARYDASLQEVEEFLWPPEAGDDWMAVPLDPAPRGPLWGEAGTWQCPQCQQSASDCALTIHEDAEGNTQKILVGPV